ncbi:hypothetical protein AVEN_119032-1 [Araneus ventricosus]|uniref:Uncharacterized protein n=1 Tax=Araneus ventricosus TaxID=182803 RepID=A0A4Y2FFV9_ARAVE|nr:hypothetical protein AVEN_119032-1 [Araneus ventricosus]
MEENSNGELFQRATRQRSSNMDKFSVEVDVNPIEKAESAHFVPPENWSNLSDVTAFEEFVQCDLELVTCSLITIAEMIANQETSSEEEDNCTEKPLPSFQKTWAGFNTM